MSGLGGFCPLPLRLGGVDAETSWGSGDHAAACRDLVAAARTLPFAHAVVSRSGSARSLTQYRGANGCALADGPAVAVSGSYAASMTFPAEWTDALGVRRAIKIDHVEAAPANAQQVIDVGTTATATLGASGGLQIITTSILADGGAIRVTVWGSYLDTVAIEDYDGATDKTDSETERTPYAWSLIQMLRDARGSAYTRERGTLVHVENLALARAHAASWRRAERLSCNGNPALAVEKADEWRQVLGVRRRDGDTNEKLRQRNAAKLRAALGPTRMTVDDAVAGLMGPLYVRTWRNYDGTTIADDNLGTFWPTVNPGAPSRDMGGGAWYSDRSHIVVELVRTASVSALEWQEKLADLTELLDLMLPATATFDWCVGADDGFTLDEDLLDEGCLGTA